MGGAQPLAITMNGGVALCVEVDPHRIERRIQTRYLDRSTNNVAEALAWAEDARNEGRRSRSGSWATPRTSCRNFSMKALSPMS